MYSANVTILQDPMRIKQKNSITLRFNRSFDKKNRAK